MPDFSRREFIYAVTATTVAGIITRTAPGAALQAQSKDQSSRQPLLRWLDSRPAANACITGTVPWPRGALKKDQSLQVKTPSGEPVPTQTEQLAYWPDGSVKWTMHTIATGDKPADTYVVAEAEAKSSPMAVRESATAFEIDTGAIQCLLPKAGPLLIESIKRGNQTILSRGQLVVHLQNDPDRGALESYSSLLRSVAVESTGSLCTVVKIDGVHQSEGGRSILPFTVRLYLHQNSDEIRLLHTFIYDLNEQADFIRGIAVRFDVPMKDEEYNRHVRFVGDGPGLFAEAIKGITGLRRDPGDAVRKAQIDGVATPPIDQWNAVVSKHLDRVPACGDYTLTQWCADGFQIRKRTRAGFGWIAAGAGKRSRGAAYIGGSGGGVAFGMRDFWQKHPAQIDIRDAHTDLAQVTMWLWSPDAPAMDLRFYHDGLGENTYPKQNEGLDITYEDFEPGYGTPFGVARTSEMKLKAVAATPSRQALIDFADALQTPPMLVCEPQRYLDAGVFASLWTLPDRSTPAKTLIEDELDFYLNQYLKEIDQRSWYGFWDFGDVRHAYDADRHVWRYDVGGFAWDNSELSTDLWLWYSFLRTGRADIFRMAEAMTRHTGEVDVYHLGPHKGLGTRHGVQHWGDSSKQTRISSAAFRRPYFYLTGDARTGDLMHDQVSECETWLTNYVERKLGLPPRPTPTRQAAPWGALNWGNLASTWFTQIERTEDAKLQEKLLNTMNSIPRLPHGFFTDNVTMNLDTGIVTGQSNQVYIEHLTACFGLPEIAAELSKTYSDRAPQFADAWAQYGKLYNASNEEKKAALGDSGKKVSMPDAHSRCAAFAANHLKDPALAKRAWQDWLDRRTPDRRRSAITTRHIEGPDVLNPIDEANISTNSAAQYCLSTMQNLALIGDALSPTP